MCQNEMMEKNVRLRSSMEIRENEREGEVSE